MEKRERRKGEQEAEGRAGGRAYDLGRNSHFLPKAVRITRKDLRDSIVGKVLTSHTGDPG